MLQVESLLIMWRVTGDPIYREMGWFIFEAFEKHAHVSGGGYSPIKVQQATGLTQGPHRLACALSTQCHSDRCCALCVCVCATAAR